MKCLWIDDQLSDFHYGNQYSKLFEDLITKPKKIWTTKDAFDYIDRHDDFDSVIIDLNMEEQDESLKDDRVIEAIKAVLTPKFYKKNEDNIKKLTGYAIYLKLIYSGFPKENICFLSANVTPKLQSKDLSFFEQIKDLLKEEKRDKDVLLQKLDVFQQKGFQIQYKRTFERHVKRENYDALMELVDQHIEQEKNKSTTEHQPAPTEVGQRFDDLLDHFEDVGLQRPVVCAKVNAVNNPDFQAWKKRINENAYYTLRTGIIAGCNAMIDKLKKDDFKADDIQFKTYVKDVQENDEGRKKRNSGDADKAKLYQDKQHYIHLFTSIKNTLPVRAPFDKQNYYKQILNYLTHDWESATEIKYSYKTKFGKPNLYRVQNNTFGCMMKLLRNWLAHNKIAELSPKDHDVTIKEKDIAFIFMIAMRSFIRSPKLIQEYESILLSLFEEPITDDYFTKITKGENPKLVELIKESFNQITSRDEKWFIPEPNVYQKYVSIGHNEGMDTCSIKDLYRMFWHGMFYTDWKDNGDRTDFSNWEINVNVEQSIPYFSGKDNKAFLHKMYCHTFNEIFKKEEGKQEDGFAS